MSRVVLDLYTKKAAIDYANTEAEIRGFKKGSAQWDKAFKEYLAFAVGTMSAGRNPRNFRYKVNTTLYPEIFSSDGFAGRISENYIAGDNKRGLPLLDVQSRILSALMNLVKLFENGIAGVKNTAISQSGKIKETADMSELQIPNRENFGSKDEFNAAVRDVIYHWIMRDVVTNAVLESLMPFFKMTKNDIEEILDALNVEEADIKEMTSGKRELVIKKLRARVKPKIDQLSYRKMVLG